MEQQQPLPEALAYEISSALHKALTELGQSRLISTATLVGALRLFQVEIEDNYLNGLSSVSPPEDKQLEAQEPQEPV